MLKRIEGFFIQGLIYTAVFFFSLSSILYAFQTFLRIFFNQAIFWIDPLTSYLFALTALYGSALAILKDENIKIEIFKKLNQNRRITFLRESLAFLATLVLLSIFFVHLRAEFITDDTSFLGIKKWLLDVPYIFFLLASGVFYFNKIRSAFHKD